MTFGSIIHRCCSLKKSLICPKFPLTGFLLKSCVFDILVDWQVAPEFRLGDVQVSEGGVRCSFVEL